MHGLNASDIIDRNLLGVPPRVKGFRGLVCLRCYRTRRVRHCSARCESLLRMRFGIFRRSSTVPRRTSPEFHHDVIWSIRRGLRAKRGTFCFGYWSKFPFKKVPTCYYSSRGPKKKQSSQFTATAPLLLFKRLLLPMEVIGAVETRTSAPAGFLLRSFMALETCSIQ
jgi:hypothetical protein